MIFKFVSLACLQFWCNGGVPWLSNTEDALCFICKENVKNVNHFLLECREFPNNFDSISLNLRQKIVSVSPINGPQIFYFYSSFEPTA